MECPQEPSDGIYLIIEGFVKATRWPKLDLDGVCLEKGSYFGEKFVHHTSNVDSDHSYYYTIIDETTKLAFIPKEIVQFCLDKDPHAKKTIKHYAILRTLNLWISRLKIWTRFVNSRKLLTDRIKIFDYWVRKTKPFFKDHWDIKNPSFDSLIHYDSLLFTGRQPIVKLHQAQEKAIRDFLRNKPEPYYESIAPHASEDLIEYEFDELKRNLWAALCLEKLASDRLLTHPDAIKSVCEYIHILRYENKFLGSSTDNFGGELVD